MKQWEATLKRHRALYVDIFYVHLILDYMCLFILSLSSCLMQIR